MEYQNEGVEVIEGTLTSSKVEDIHRCLPRPYALSCIKFYEKVQVDTLSSNFHETNFNLPNI